MARGCLEEANSAFQCQDIQHEKTEVHYCNCRTAGCNKDWDSAASGAEQRVLAAGLVLTTLILLV